VNPAAASQPETKGRGVLFETLAILLFAYFPSAIAGWLHEPLYELIPVRTLSAALGHVGIIAAILFVIWQSGDPRSQFGFTRFRWRDLLWAAAAIVIEIGCHLLSRLAFHGKVTSIVAGYHLYNKWQDGLLAWSYMAWMVLWIPISAASQEVLMRGYLVTRLSELFGRVAPAVFVSAVLFSAWHTYEGASAAAATFLSGLAMAGIFLKTRSLWPLILAHSVYNGLAYFT
jgi:membrane protease YdiL (CAAX protease family)